MKIGSSFPGFDISAKGLSIQRKKMNLISENIANANTINAETNQPYKRKTLEVKQSQGVFANTSIDQMQTIPLFTSNENHINGNIPSNVVNSGSAPNQMQNEIEDNSPGDKVYMPESPNADDKGYVQLSNVNIITEMTDMIVATRSYEANLTAFNSSKQMAKDTLEI
ncbi:MAG: flagellar basal body rod protein FlgC [Ignavibacteriaceae bacterium]|jgi:flagellar basal-body rod protein FlgC